MMKYKTKKTKYNDQEDKLLWFAYGKRREEAKLIFPFEKSSGLGEKLSLLGGHQFCRYPYGVKPGVLTCNGDPNPDLYNL